MSKLDQLLSSGVVAVVRGVAEDKVPKLTETLIEAGITGIEITLDSDGAYQLIQELSEKHQSDQALIGAGTVLNKEQAEKALDAGAEFIFGPILDKETVEFTKEKGVIVIPGVYTPTEMQQAYQWGADVVKVFPARSLGPNYFKDVNGPLGHIPKMPTGGIDLNNIGAFIQAGAVAAGVGGSLIDKKKIEAGDWDAIKKEAAAYLDEVKKARK
ncbi:bifunctional 4-hydroxy-2-oxoglutarate aldolase/2-dehydro-3-deoxy-phosphogluconate aldolase [Alkalicoccus daliensis]|uniref:2-keto-3-deoxy-phosphogluconate aldolase n=1 Tax=Alkalicoccus daliensis TaxID=745820 RepID=A0A1H0GJY4_9BACI|nr:bifunctional 4-hydroxy-2-oxoglutarate aldolase/2-dehydro-3-deoxy-phosphogluconate aldolase [Alkalicoccus daliensis]SDO07164.1 2-keto-3-deoxy-phosphogluconate aldolase [Alkalicoccus daliensis]